MKKKILLTLTVVFAALAAAFGLAGCFGAGGDGTDAPPATKREYAVFDDGCGKKYRLSDGEQITAYYGYDAEKVLDFTLTYYNEATNEATRTVDDLLELPCNKPNTYTYNASPLNEDGADKGVCDLTVIVTAQAMTNQLVENGRPVRANIYENAGAVYTFIPEMTGAYTVSCVCDEDVNEAEFTVTDNTGAVVDGSENGVFNKGWTYYVHVGVKVGGNYTAAGVETSVAFTPLVLEEGENEVTIGTSNTFEFTPEESGAYSADDDAEGGYRWLDGETYRQITELQWENEVLLQAGKKYFVDGQVGYASDRQAKLTVKRVDREFAQGTENALKCHEMYVFTAGKTSNYKFTAELENYFAEATFNVYSYEGEEEYSERFSGNSELNFVLGEGKHIINVNEDCTAKVSRAPQKLEIGGLGGISARNGEVISFTAPISCAYGFASFSHDSAEFAVTDKDGNDMSGERLTAGEEYQVAVTFGEEGVKSILVTAAPATEGEIVLNRAFQPTAGGVYEFACGLDGIYKFDGADGLEIYDSTCEAVETDGDSAYLLNTQKYYVIMSVDTPAEDGEGETQEPTDGAEAQAGGEVRVIFYPNAIPVDTKVKIMATGYMRIELTEGCEVRVAVKLSDKKTCKIFDADMNEIKSVELSQIEQSSTVTHTFEEAGIYYFFVERLGSVPEISFVTRPAGCAGEFVAGRGSWYSFATDGACRFEGVSEGDEFTVTIGVGVRAQGILDCVKVYYEDSNGAKRYLNLQKLNGGWSETAFTFTAVTGVETYFVEVAGGLNFVIE